MVNRNTPHIARNTDKINDNTPSDELIRSLSDAYENQRARQVFEWERTRRQAPPALFV
jgi:hypothetical protein